MIVRMKKVSVLLYHRERENFLASLQDLGVVHIVELPEKDASSLQEIATRIKECERILRWLEHVQHQNLPQRFDKPPEAIMAAFDKLEAERLSIELHLQQAAKEGALLRPWGDFDPDLLTRLSAAGVVVKFYELSQNAYTALVEQGVMLVPVTQQRRSIRCVLIAHGEVPTIDAEEIHLPATSLGAIQKRIAELQKAYVRVEQQMHDLAAYTEVLKTYGTDQKNRFAVLSAALDLAPCVGGKIISLTGWCPVAREREVAAFLGKFPAWFSFSEPAPDDDVPVLLHNNRVVRLFEPITRLFSLPHYYECDPTPFFAPFFALFVGLCIGDVGYGALMVLASYIALRNIKAPQARPYCIMLLLLGSMTMLGGIMLNTCFGTTLFGGPGVPSGTALINHGAQFFAPLAPVVRERGITYPMMNFALLLGVLQVVLALVLRAVNSMRMQGVVFGLQPLAYLSCLLGGFIWAAHTNFMRLDVAGFTVGPARIGALLAAVPAGIGTAMLWGGITLIFFFNNPDKKLSIRLPLGIWELYGFATGILGDILSYMRLFALGLSSGLLGASFNKLAFMLVTKAGVIEYVSPLMLVSILLLVLGHGLNLLLSLVGAFVHPLRLTFVEFYKNLGFRGGGKPYAPLAKIR